MKTKSKVRTPSQLAPRAKSPEQVAWEKLMKQNADAHFCVSIDGARSKVIAYGARTGTRYGEFDPVTKKGSVA